MTGAEAWSIQPAEVATVLTGVTTQAELMGTELAGLQGNVESAAGATGNSPAIADALMGFFEQEGPRLESVSTRINASLSGASLATEAYVKGDYEMAESSQRTQVQLVNGAPRPPHGAAV